MNKAQKLILCSYLLIAVSTICHNQANAAATGNTLNITGTDNQHLQDNVSSYQAYLSNSIAAINNADLQTSELNYQSAVAALVNHPDKANIIRDFDYERAILLIHKTEYATAAKILAQYVYSENANMRMQSDYLEALFRLGEYSKVVAASQKFWGSNYTNVPKHGLTLLADSLFKLRKYSQAAPKYRLILTRNNNSQDSNINLSLAYCLAMLNQDDKAMTIYEQLYNYRTDAEELLVSEYAALIEHDQRQLANKLYQLILSRSKTPSKVQLAKSKVLANNGYTIQAAQALSTTSTDTTLQPEYHAQLFSNSLGSELYHTADHSLHQLRTTTYYPSAAVRYRQARKGGLTTAFSSMSNYKGNSLQSYRVDSDSYWGLNTYITAAIDTTRLSDTVHTTSVTTSTIGLVHRFERGKLHASISNAVNGSAHTLYNAGFTYKLTDMTSIGFDLGKRYIGDSKAVINSFIKETYYTLSMAHRLNRKNIFFADYTTATLTDNNHAYGYSLSYSYYPVKDRNKTHELYTYYRRSGFSKPSPYYESPDKRIAYGAGWQAQWNSNNGSYWITRLNLELGHDNLEPTDFSPSIRVQYTHPVGKRQEISLATEYGLHTNKLNNINYFMHGYKQFDIKYTISW